MKKILKSAVFCILMLLVTGCGCAKKEPISGLENMKTSAEAAGYEINNSYGQWDSKVVNGFTVVFPNLEADITTNVLQFENSKAASDYTKKLKDMGYKKVFVKDNYVIPATGDGSVSDKYPEEYYTFLENLINDLPLQKVTK